MGCYEGFVIEDRIDQIDIKITPSLHYVMKILRVGYNNDPTPNQEKTVVRLTDDRRNPAQQFNPVSRSHRQKPSEDSFHINAHAVILVYGNIIALFTWRFLHFLSPPRHHMANYALFPLCV